ncbi:MAG: MipA/OmpV family protein [Rhizobiaceae bacterium]|nr:MipA/OmpV family protein [Rhizobiaceae bacterium]MCV0405384.1 MipA/OmpV family protein [Rhizobiaceae bacterium]
MAYWRSAHLPVAALCSLLSAVGVSRAADAISASEALPTYQEDVFSEDRWGVEVGGFAGFMPAYEGSDEFRFVGYPLIIPKYYGPNHGPKVAPWVEFKGIDDVRITALRLGGLDIGAAGGYTFGRDENLSARLRGLDEVDGGINVGGFAAYRFDPFYVDVAYLTQVTGDTDTGHTIRFGAGVEQDLDERATVSAYLNGSYASEGYMDAYFSVTPAQAAASAAGLGVFDAGAGFKDVGVDLGFDYRLSERMTLKTKAGYSRLLNDAADSPITSSRNQFTGGLGLTYTFGRTE